MNFGGIIAGAMQGGAQAVQGMAQQYIQDESRANLAQIEADIQLSRQKALEAYRQQTADSARTKRAGEINSRAQGIVDRQQADDLSDFYNEGQVGGRRLNPEDLSDEEKAAAPVSDDRRARARQRAAEELGYIDPKDEAANNARTAAIEGQNQRLQERLSSNERIAADRNQAAEDRLNARLDAELEKANMKVAAGAAKDRLTTMINTAHAAIKQLSEEPPRKTKQAEQARLDELEVWRERRQRWGGLLDDSRSSPSGKAPGAAKQTSAPAAGSGRTDVQEALKLFYGN